MRTDWLPLSASALVIGAMSLVLGSLLNPTTPGGGARDTFLAVAEESGRWMGMSVAFFLASLMLTLGLPAILSLFARRGRRLGLVGVAVFAVGAIGTSGYAMLLVFFRALVVEGQIQAKGIEQVAHEAGLSFFLYSWIAGFYLGVALLAVALLVARKTPRWVPVLLLVFVASFPLGGHLGRVGQAVQVMLFAVAFTGIAIEAVSAEHKRELEHVPVF